MVLDLLKEKFTGLALRVAGLELADNPEYQERIITPIPDNYYELPWDERAKILSNYLQENGVRLRTPFEAEYQMVAWEKRRSMLEVPR
jgi:hypothetical protein